MKLEVATYCSSDFLPFLEVCLAGFAIVAGVTPKVYALDEDTATYCVEKRLDWLPHEPHVHRHVSSLSIIRDCRADVLVLVDADCWLLQKTAFDRILDAMSAPDIAGAGDIGCVDLPYLFRALDREELFVRLHETMAAFPKFSSSWASSAIIDIERPNTGCVVSIPLLYGGLAGYRPETFRDMSIPEWIYSADIFLSMFAFEHANTLVDIGRWQFNRQIDHGFGALHFCGSKPSPTELEKSAIDYRDMISATAEDFAAFTRRHR